MSSYGEYGNNERTNQLVTSLKTKIPSLGVAGGAMCVFGLEAGVALQPDITPRYAGAEDLLSPAFGHVFRLLKGVDDLRHLPYRRS